MARHAACAVLLLLVVACRSRPTAGAVPVVDFIKEFDRADRRPLTYAVASSAIGGAPLPAIVGPAPGRLTWTLPIPRGAEFRSQAAAAGGPVHLRVGVSDNRVYEGLAEASIAPGAAWAPVTVDLSRYAGWKASLFYRPEAVQWHLVLSADAAAGPATMAWGTPVIVASRSNALEYAARRARLTRSAAP